MVKWAWRSERWGPGNVGGCLGDGGTGKGREQWSAKTMKMQTKMNFKKKYKCSHRPKS